MHLPPFAAFFAPRLITELYQIPSDDAVFALLQHRAALFGLVVIACIWAAFDDGVRPLVTVLAGLSMISFLVIYQSYGQPASLRTIALVDLTALPLLAFVGWRAFSAP